MKTSQSNRTIGHFSRSLALAAAVIAGIASTSNAQQEQQNGGGGRRNQLQQDQNNQDQQGGRQRQFQQDPNNQDPNAMGGGRRGRGGGGPGGGGFNGNNGGGGFGGRQQQMAAMQQNSNADSFTQEYGDLSAHNIFMRDRRQPEPRRVVDTGPRAPEDSIFVIGVVKQDDGAFQAYIEDTATRQPAKLFTLDAPVATGKIIEINSVGIVYKPADKEAITVPVGANLFGVSGSVSSARVSAIRGSEFNGFSAGQNNLPTNGRGGNFGTAFNNNTGGGRGGRGGNAFNQPATPVVAPPPLPGTEGMSMEERMRMRRSTEGLPSAAVPVPAQPEAPAPVVEAAPAPVPIVAPEIGGGLSIEEQMRLRRQLQQ